MKVKNIFFIPSIPGLPVYEMDGGQILVPFTDLANKMPTQWFSQEQVLKTVKEDVHRRRIKDAFQKAAYEISQIKHHKLNGSVVQMPRAEA